MRCVDFERRLQELLDEHPDGSSCFEALPIALDLHAAKCEACRSTITGYRQLFAGMAAIPRLTTSATFVERVMVQAIPRHERSSVVRTLTALATAASIFLALSLVIATRLPVTKTVPQSISKIAAEQSIDSASIVNANLDFSNSSAKLISPPPRMARSRLDQTSFEVVLNLAGLSPVTFSADVLEAHLTNQPPWMVEVTDGLKPVTESMTGTFNALLRDWPRSAESSDNDQGAWYERYSRYERII